MDDLPFDVPVLLRSYYELDLQNLHGMDVAKCVKVVQGEHEFVCMVLRRVDKNNVAIQSHRNQRFLSVNDAGDCRFAAVDTLTDKNKFAVETRVISSTSNHLFFVSRNTGKTLQSVSCGSVRCENFNRNYREAWAIVELTRARSSVGEQPSASMGTEDAVSGMDERRWWILELVKAGKTPKEIEQVIALMYPPDKSAAVKTER